MNVSGRARLSALTLAALTLGGLAAWGFLDHMRTPKLTPELRGYELAERLGCHGCHGPGGTGGVSNPQSREGHIPAWDGGTAMMYIESEDEIREWILEGRPWRMVLRDSLRARHAPLDTMPSGVALLPRPSDPVALPVRMPAYRDVVDERELEDLVAYYKAVANYGDMPAQARAGYRAARAHGCFGCHGPGGLIGVRNPRSFKGYIPPWHGSDFEELVRDDGELRAWILDGTIARLDGNRGARFFTRRQIVKMPAYRGVLPDSSVADVMAYIRWVSTRSP